MVRRIAWVIAVAGTLVFAAITVALFSRESHLHVPAIAALVTLCAILLSHLGGIESGLALREEESPERLRAAALAISIFPSAAAWAVLWLPSPQWQIGAAGWLFAAVWAADLWLARHGLLPSWFVDLRTAVTFLVCALLGLAYWLL